MRTHRLSIAAIVMISTLGIGMGCKRSAEARSQDATTFIRSMHHDTLEAQKKVIAKFKVLPEADELCLNMDKDLDAWAVSEKNLSAEDEDQEKALIAFQKDSKEEALIGELRLYAKKAAKKCQEKIPELEAILAKNKKEAAEGQFTYAGQSLPLGEKDKKNRLNNVKLLDFQIEYLKDRQRIATEYEAKLAKLLN